MMKWFVVLAFLFSLVITFSNAAVTELLSPQDYEPTQPVTQVDSVSGSFGLLTNSLKGANLVRRKRAFDTYITGFCYSPQVTIFDFSGGYNRRHPRGCHGNRGRGRRWG